MIGWLQAQAWKLGACTAGAVAVVLALLLVVAKLHAADQARDIAALSKSINDPVTGYIAQAAQCRTNVATLQTKLDQQTQRVKDVALEGQRQMAALEVQLAGVRAENQRLDRRAADILNYTAKGATACERQSDILNHYLEGLK